MRHNEEGPSDCWTRNPSAALWVIHDREGRSRTTAYVRFAPKADKKQVVSVCLLRAKSERMHRNEQDRYEQRPEQVIGRHASKRSPVAASRRASIEVFGAGALAFWRYPLATSLNRRNVSM